METKGRANVYELTENFNPILKKEKLNITDEIKELIAYEYGDDDLLDILKEDKQVPDLSIMDHDESIRLPSW